MVFGGSFFKSFIDSNAAIFGLTNPDLPKDSLASKQFQTLIDLISEGVISGFPSATGSQGSTEYNTSALKDVFLNGTQVLQQAAGTSPNDTDFNLSVLKLDTGITASSPYNSRAAFIRASRSPASESISGQLVRCLPRNLSQRRSYLRGSTCVIPNK